MRGRFVSTVLAAGLALLALAGAACAHYVVVEDPPAVNLRQYPTIGLVQFRSEKEALAKNVTQRFLATMQNAQPGVKVLQLGAPDAVLAAVGGSSFDPATLQKIGQKWQVQAIVIGQLNVSRPRPQVQVGTNLNSLSADMQVDGDLTATLYSAAEGLTLWTNGAHGTWSFGGVGLGGGTRIGVADPVRKYHQMLAELVEVTTRDFRSTWVRRKVETVD